MAGRMGWLAAAMVLSGLCPGGVAEAGSALCGGPGGPSLFAGGTGFPGSPYRISSSSQFEAITATAGGPDYLDCDFVQSGDITLTAPWTPIGLPPEVFRGVYDGAGFTIRGLSITEGGDYVGLFGAAEFAVIRNVSLIGVAVSGGEFVGGLLGSGQGTAIGNVLVTGTVSGREQVGGIAGRLGPLEGDRSSLTGAHSAVEVGVADSLDSFGFGGAVGLVESSDLAQVSASGAVTGVIDVGGIVGRATEQSTVRSSRSSGAVSGNFEGYPGGVGGIVGTLVQSHISDSYATGAVTATGPDALAGGIVGFVEGTENADAFVSAADVERVYAVGAVSGEAAEGGVIGILDFFGTVVDSHWSSDLSGTAAAIGVTYSGSGDPENSTEAQLLAIDTYVGWAMVDGWSPFDPPDAVWGICDDHRLPYLLWERRGTPCGWTVRGFLPPVDMDKVLNVAQAGRMVPLMWSIVDGDGVPVSDPSSFVKIASSSWECATRTGTVEDGVEKYAVMSGMRYLGSGRWQFSWPTSKTWAGECRTVTLELSDGTTIAADFRFRR